MVVVVVVHVCNRHGGVRFVNTVCTTPFVSIHLLEWSSQPF